MVAAWDEDAGRYAWARRGGSVPPELAQLTRGQGLFLWVSGTEPVAWTRPASQAGMLLTLPAGYSLVGWAGLDGTPIAEAVGRFGDALVGASRWNAETQSYERYEPGAAEPTEDAPALRHGDALWVELSAERRWWQSGTERTRFVFQGKVTPAHESELREEMERVVAFFAERYRIEPPPFSVRVAPQTSATSASRDEILLGRGSVDDRSSSFWLAHEYFHVLQFDLARQHPSGDGAPTWMTEGSAQYATSLYHRERRGETGDRARVTWWRESLRVDGPLQFLEDSQLFYTVGSAAYDLGALATDWLVRRAAALSGNVPFAPLEPGGLDARLGYDAHVEYYRLLRSSVSWQAAFKEAFAISVNDFYPAFEAYRTALTASRLPHLVDDVDEPILVFEGEIPAETVARVRAEFESVQVFFRERLGGGPVDYTLSVSADRVAAGSGSLVTWFARQQFTRVVERLAPFASLQPVAYGYRRDGAVWLTRGLAGYAEAAARAVVGVETFAQTRSRSTAAARLMRQPLRNFETSAGIEAVGGFGTNQLGFLAADWLVERAGERSIFEYYRRLPSSRNWQEAFRRAFRITIDDFYVAFEAYRREIAPPQPHEADDQDEPILVLLGEIPPDTAATVRTQFDALQAFFRDRLGSRPADYTLYVAADAEAAADAHLRVFGRESDGLTCNGRGAHAGFISLTCGGGLPFHVAWMHFDDVRSRLAPKGARIWRPYWLQTATINYMIDEGSAAAGIPTDDDVRRRHVATAARTAEPLRSFELPTSGSGTSYRVIRALSVLAGEWLVERAGEAALFRYYWLLGLLDTWEEAFAAAFGLSIDDFYAAFEAYRADGFTS